MTHKFAPAHTIFNTDYSLPLSAEACKMKEHILLCATVSFAKSGYASVSMRDLAKTTGINLSTIYNHFESKKALWKAVIENAKRLYLLHFEYLESRLVRCATLEQALDTIFCHPRAFIDVFTCYAFSLVQTEQHRDPLAGKVFEEIFLAHGIGVIKKWLSTFSVGGAGGCFDAGAAAIVIVHSILAGVQVEVHHLLKHTNKNPYDPRKMIEDVQNFIVRSAGSDRDASIRGGTHHEDDRQSRKSESPFQSDGRLRIGHRSR